MLKFLGVPASKNNIVIVQFMYNGIYVQLSNFSNASEPSPKPNAPALCLYALL